VEGQFARLASHERVAINQEQRMIGHWTFDIPSRRPVAKVQGR
jgi:hypothetical protein